MTSRKTIPCLLFLLALLGCSKPARVKKTPPPASTKPPARAVEAPKPASQIVEVQKETTTRPTFKEQTPAPHQLTQAYTLDNLPAAPPDAPKPAIKSPPRVTEQSTHDEKKLFLRVTWVGDGDTLIGVDSANHQIKIRFFGIDAPESEQTFGQASKKALSQKVFGKDISVVVMDTDDHGRTVGRVFVDELDVNLEQVKEGMAWHYKFFSHDPALAAAEKSARESKKGLWSDSDPMPPWDWRRNEKNRKGN